MAVSGASPRAVRSRLVATKICSVGVRPSQFDGSAMGPRPSAAARPWAMAASAADTRPGESSYSGARAALQKVRLGRDVGGRRRGRGDAAGGGGGGTGAATRTGAGGLVVGVTGMGGAVVEGAGGAVVVVVGGTVGCGVLRTSEEAVRCPTPSVAGGVPGWMNSSSTRSSAMAAT